jgi:polyphosphate glucokinase
LERRGAERWRKSVLDVIERLRAALICEAVLLGGGNAKLMQDLPAHVTLGANSNAIDGGIKLWQDVSDSADVIVAASANTPKPTKSATKGG